MIGKVGFSFTIYHFPILITHLSQQELGSLMAMTNEKWQIMADDKWKMVRSCRLRVQGRCGLATCKTLPSSYIKVPAA